MKLYKKISIYLGIGLLILAISDYFIPNESFLKDYVRGSFTETLGIIITLIFVDKIFNSYEEKINKKEERKKILRVNKLLKAKIDQYILYTYMLITPLDDRNDGEPVKLTEGFKFNDMYDLFRPSLLIFDDNKSVVLKSLDQQNEIKKLIDNILLTIDFKFYSEIETLFLEHTSTMSKFNIYDGIERDSKIEEVTTIICRMIKEHTGTLEYRKSNIINTYIALYNLINLNIEFIAKYEKVINALIEEND